MLAAKHVVDGEASDFSIDGKSKSFAPQISILVLCYNSQNFVFETIDSVFEQDYCNIQLLVSDDGSVGFPAESIERYMIERCPKNVSCKLNVNPENVGTVKHFETLWRQITGEIVYIIAGDDVLAGPNVITTVIEHFQKEGRNCSVVTTQVEMWNHCLSEKIEDFLSTADIELLRRRSCIEILCRLAQSCFIAAPGTFFRKDALGSIGMLSNRYYLIEDYPIYCRLAFSGYQFQFCDCISAKHRAGGVSQNPANEFIRLKFLFDKLQVLATELYPHIGTLPVEYRYSILNNYNHTARQLSLIDKTHLGQDVSDSLAIALLGADAYASKARALERDNASLANSIKALKRTFSWRITKPLRAIKRMLKRSKTS